MKFSLEARKRGRVVSAALLSIGLVVSHIARGEEDKSDATSDPKLEAIGTLSATSVVAIESFLGTAADGLSEQVYKQADEITPDLERIVGMLEACRLSLKALPEGELSDQDKQFIERLSEIYALQQGEAQALIAFARTKNKSELQKWLKARETARPKIVTLLSGDQPIAYENIKQSLGDSLQKAYVHFTFSYPNTWKVDAKSGQNGESNFIRIEASAEENGETHSLENFAVGTLTFEGEVNEDNEIELLKQVTNQFAEQFAQSFPNFQKKKQGPVKLGKYQGYGMDFTSQVERKDDDDLEIFGRVVFLPPAVTKQANGATVIMMATSLAEGIDSLADLGVNGDLPAIIESFDVSPLSKTKAKKKPTK